jgi:hypothetical protein
MRSKGLSARRRRIFLLRFVQVDEVDVAAVGHDRGDALLVQAQHVGDDLLLALVEHAGLGALLHQHVDLVVGDRRLILAFRAQHPQRQAGRGGQQPDQGAGTWARVFMGRAIREAMPSGASSPRRLGTSSPITTEK